MPDVGCLSIFFYRLPIRTSILTTQVFEYKMKKNVRVFLITVAVFVVFDWGKQPAMASGYSLAGRYEYRGRRL